jgi:hypothetical protein
MALPPLQDAQKIDQIAFFVFGQADAKAAREAVELVTIARRTGFRIRLKGKKRLRASSVVFIIPLQ